MSLQDRLVTLFRLRLKLRLKLKLRLRLKCFDYIRLDLFLEYGFCNLVWEKWITVIVYLLSKYVLQPLKHKDRLIIY